MKSTTWLFSAVFSAFISIAASAQADNLPDNCPCCEADFRSFDFWIGEWIVKDTLGTILGENTIKMQEQGCILSEYWRGAKGSTGMSMNYYDRSDKSWNQLWIDSSGNVLKLKGKGSDGIMVLVSEVQKSDKGAYRSRITWTKNKDGSVTQRWDILDAEKEEVRNTIFNGVYHPK